MQWGEDFIAAWNVPASSPFARKELSLGLQPVVEIPAMPTPPCFKQLVGPSSDSSVSWRTEVCGKEQLRGVIANTQVFGLQPLIRRNTVLPL